MVPPMLLIECWWSKTLPTHVLRWMEGLESGECVGLDFLHFRAGLLFDLVGFQHRLVESCRFLNLFIYQVVVSFNKGVHISHQNKKTKTKVFVFVLVFIRGVGKY